MKTKKFYDLEFEWYSTLKETGFVDIEEVHLKDRPLKKWSGIGIHDGLAKEIVYQEPLIGLQSNFPNTLVSSYEALLYRDDFNDICEFVCRHGNRSLMSYQIRQIWIYYIDGGTTRSIGRSLNIHHSTIFRIIQALRQWL
jgi:hypothetical protein